MTTPTPDEAIVQAAEQLHPLLEALSAVNQEIGSRKAAIDEHQLAIDRLKTARADLRQQVKDASTRLVNAVTAATP